jgi:heparosan-N-sulfate-glucuronate 5-epimerase
MSLPVGPASDPGAVRGYPIDLRVKATSESFPPPEWGGMSWSYVAIAQFGLGCFERWLAGEGETWLNTALMTGRYLLDNQESDGSWLHRTPFPHTFPMGVPWLCGMAQGEAASLLVRLHLETAEERFAHGARNAISPLSRSVGDGGVCRLLDGMPWPEEYPTDPPSFVLNGAIFAWWGVRDIGVGLRDREASSMFEAGADALAANVSRFDTGRWSLYCLRRFPVPHVASSFYHALHINQLEAMHTLAPRPQFETVRRRWIEYTSSAPLRWLALSEKVLFRVVVPRNRLLANRLPWTRR